MVSLFSKPEAYAACFPTSQCLPQKKESACSRNVPTELFETEPITLALRHSPLWRWNLAMTAPIALKMLAFFLTIIIFNNFKIHENHPVCLLFYISLTSSIPTCIAALITYSHGCAVELNSWNYFTSDILK